MVAIALLTGAAYFLAARLSLILLTEPDGVAVFWPAAGISSGVLIALGQSARLPVAASVMVATALANLIGDRNLAGSIVFAMCNAGEAIIIAWLIEHYFGSGFALDNLRRVLGFLLATLVGTAISGIGGTAGFILFHSSEAYLSATWLHWFTSDALGVVLVAPLESDLRAVFPIRGNCWSWETGCRRSSRSSWSAQSDLVRRRITGSQSCRWP